MAWTSVKTWSAGEIVTAAMMNTYVSSNDEALRAGGLAISSQASGDYIKASSATQLSRIAGSGVFADVSPLTTRGDLLYGSSGTPTGSRLAVGGAGTHVGSDGTDVSWEADPTFAGLSPLTTRGDVLTGSSGTPTGARLAVGGAGTHLGTDGTDVAWEADPTFATLSPLTTRGDLLVGTSGAVTGARLGKGSSGQFLSMADADDIGWAAASGGKVLQVIAATYATMATTSLSAYGDTGLTAAITCSSTDSKVAVFMAIGGCQKDTANTKVQVKCLRDATQIGIEPNACYNGSTAALSVGVGAVFNILDSPSSTDELIYKAQFASQSGGNAYTQVNGATSSVILVELDFS